MRDRKYKRRNAPILQKHLSTKRLSLARSLFTPWAALFALFCLNVAPPAQAQTPTPTPEATCPPAMPTPACATPTPCEESIGEPGEIIEFPSPSPTALPTQFQPGDGTNLQWRPYKPNQGTWGAPPWHTIIVVHGGEFRYGSFYDIDCERVCQDLQNQGYYVLSVIHRLAPCNIIDGQHDHDGSPEGIASGRPPQQTDDIKTAILAARADTTNVKGDKIGVLGGSSGASHGIFAVLDKDPTPGGGYPKWCLDGNDDRPACGVGLSGAYNFADRDTNITGKFVKDIVNYTGTCSLPDEFNVSPVAKVKSEGEQAFKPAFFINSEGDSMPYRQILDIQCALQAADIPGTDYQVLTTHSIHHSFQLWHDRDPQDTTKRVRERVLEFFGAHL